MDKKINELVKLFEEKKYISVIEKAEEILQKDKKHKHANNIIAAAYEKAGNEADAIKHFNLLIEYHPNHFPPYLNLGIIFRKKGDTRKAIELLEKANNLSKNNESIISNLAECFFQLNDYVKAEDLFLKTIDINPLSLSAMYNLGNINFSKNDFETAEKYYETAMEIGIYPQILINLAAVKQKLGNLRQALVLLEDVRKKEPDNVNMLNNLGSLYLENNDFDKAEEVLEEAVTLSPNMLEAIRNLAIAKIENNKPEEAITYQEKIIKLVDNIQAHEELAQTYMLCDYPYKAIECYQNMINNYENVKPIVYVNLAECLLLTGKKDDSKTVMEKALKLYPDEPIVLTQYAKQLISNTSDASKAEKLVEKVLEMDIDDKSQAYYIKALICRFKSEFDEAIKYFKLSTSETKYEDIAWSYYLKDDLKELSSEITGLTNKNNESRLISALATHLDELKVKKNDYNDFCPDPLNFIYSNKLLKDKKQCDDMIDELNNYYYEAGNIETRHQAYLTNGTQTAGDLLSFDHEIIIRLNNIIDDHINNYISNFKNKENIFINKFPTNGVKSGWYILTENEGYLGPHIHENGWLSGVIYIDIPKRKKNEGSIVFTLSGKTEKKFNNSEVIDVTNGDIVLFPSSLWHRVNPISKKTKRLIIAFDYQPRTQRFMFNRKSNIEIRSND